MERMSLDSRDWTTGGNEMVLHYVRKCESSLKKERGLEVLHQQKWCNKQALTPKVI
ncbi:UNVERIFIED_CONTAM: hypothetical protein FKN15_002799 [Acipenser sinensis]